MTKDLIQNEKESIDKLEFIKSVFSSLNTVRSLWFKKYFQLGGGSQVSFKT